MIIKFWRYGVIPLGAAIYGGIWFSVGYLNFSYCGMKNWGAESEFEPDDNAVTDPAAE